MVIHTIYAAFVVNRSIVESSNFVIEVYMCFLVIYCFSRGSISATNSVVIVWLLYGYCTVIVRCERES